MSDVRSKIRALRVGEAAAFHAPNFEEAFPGALSEAKQVLTTIYYQGTVSVTIDGVERDIRFTRKGNQVFVACYGSKPLTSPTI